LSSGTLNYMHLANVGQTFFTWNGQKYSVQSAPPDVFDQWIREVVDRIVNVDTATWEIFHRWQIVNAAISGKFLLLSEASDGCFSIELRRIQEEKSSQGATAEEVA